MGGSAVVYPEFEVVAQGEETRIITNTIIFCLDLFSEERAETDPVCTTVTSAGSGSYRTTASICINLIISFWAAMVVQMVTTLEH